MKYKHKEWLEELRRRFGDDQMQWAFKCPACGKVSTMREFKKAGATPEDSYQTCIGRHTGKGAPVEGSKAGCNWSSYGFFNLCVDAVITDGGLEIPVFEMADKDWRASEAGDV